MNKKVIAGNIETLNIGSNIEDIEELARRLQNQDVNTQSKGELSKQLHSVKNSWRKSANWPDLIATLKCLDLLGQPSQLLELPNASLIQAIEAMEDETTATLGECNQNSKPEFNYYKARLLSQSGHFDEAIKVHGLFHSTESQFSLLSKAETGQIYWRLEQLEDSKQVFERLWKDAPNLNQYPRLAAEVGKYLASLVSPHIAYDRLGCKIELDEKIEEAFFYAEKTITYSEAVDYHDGHAWGHTVTAFALEMAGESFDVINRSYKKALELCDGELTRASSAFYIHLFQAAFYRRSKRFHRAIQIIERATDLIPQRSRFSDVSRRNEELAYIAIDQQEFTVATKHLDHAIQTFVTTESNARQHKALERLKRVRDSLG